jgi:esterase/lipase superfamily enzyme
MSKTLWGPLGKLFVDRAIVVEDQLQKALDENRLNRKGLAYNLVHMGFADEPSLMKALSDAYHLPVIDLSTVKVDTDLVKSLGIDFVNRCHMIPLERVGRKIRIAMSDPTDLMALDEIKFRTGLSIETVLAPPISIENLIESVQRADASDIVLMDIANDADVGSDDAPAARDEAMTYDLVEEGAGTIEPAAEPGPTGQWTRVPVYFATDRARAEAAEDAEDYFTARRNESGGLYFGRCTVTIPADHRIGRVERPSWLRLEFREDPRKHVVIARITEYPASAFYAELKDYLNGPEETGALVFIHGYNVTFAQAVRRTAQIAYDLEFPGPAVAYSWPSEGNVASYLADANNARWSVAHFQKFLLDLKRQAGADVINLIAHSMGSRVLAEALGGMSEEFHTGQVVFAAPDIDADVFKQLSTAFGARARRVTLYASSNDEALKLSRKLQGDYARAGETTSGVLVVAGVDSVDASLVNTGLLGHSYYGDNRSIISDIYYLLRSEMPVGKRFGMFEQTNRQGLLYWAFRP